MLPNPLGNSLSTHMLNVKLSLMWFYLSESLMGFMRTTLQPQGLGKQSPNPFRTSGTNTMRAACVAQPCSSKSANCAFEASTQFRNDAPSTWNYRRLQICQTVQSPGNLYTVIQLGCNTFMENMGEKESGSLRQQGLPSEEFLQSFSNGYV